MAVTTVAQFAAELNRPAATLLEQLQSAGVAKATTDDALNDADKERLLDYLRTAHGTNGGERKKITLTRKSTSEIKQADASGKARTIQVEVRKKRTFVQRDDSATDEQAAAAAAAAQEAELARREEEARAQAELMRKQEEELAEKRRLREAEEARVRAEAAERAAAAAAAAEKALAEKLAADAERAAAEAAKPKVPMTKSAKDAAAREAAAAAAAPAPAPAPVPEAPVAPPPEPVRQVRVIKAADAAEEESKRMNDLQARRKAAEAEAAAIRAMMSAPKKVMTAPKPVEAPKAADAAGIKGTIHKAKAAPGAAATPAGAKPGDKKAVKSEKLSSSWADDSSKKRGEAGKGRAPAGAATGAGRPGWRAPRGGARGRDRDSGSSTFQAPTEAVVQEVHVPETISVADLAHKMSVKASRSEERRVGKECRSRWSPYH